MKQVPSVPRGTFVGSNFLTPEVVSYYEGVYENRTVYVELSKGEFLDDTVWGVTFRCEHDSLLFDEELAELSTCFPSRSEAEEYINSF